MLRIFLQMVLPFLAPFILFFAYRLVAARGASFASGSPWYLLTIMGLVLVCLSMVMATLVGRGAPDAVYQPSRIENGRIVPGELRPPSAPGR